MKVLFHVMIIALVLITGCTKSCSKKAAPAPVDDITAPTESAPAPNAAPTVAPKVAKCNGYDYNTELQGCCGGNSVYNKTTEGCCGDPKIGQKEVQYRKSEQGCCNGNSLYNNDTDGCCANVQYKKAEQGCCNGNSLYNLTSQGCCSNVQYNKAEACCVSNTLYPIADPQCAQAKKEAPSKKK